MARNIVINGRFMGRPITGVERYAREIVRSIDENYDEMQVNLAGGAQVELAVPRGTRVDEAYRKVRIVEVGKLSGHLWEQYELARYSRGARLLSLANSGPVAHAQHVVVIHDAAVFRHPEAYSWQYRTLHRTLGRLLAKTAKLATVSQFSRNELSSILGLSKSMITVAHNGVDHVQRISRAPATPISMRPYILCVGSSNPTKNTQTLLDAWSMLPHGEHDLVLVGGGNGAVFNAPGKVPSEKVRMTGRISDDALVQLYKGASAFVFPSIYEGFGIPPLEALAVGCPVLAADIAPLREILSDAVLYFPPKDSTALSDMLAETLRGTLHFPPRERAANVVKRFSWSRSAKTLLEALM